MKAAAVVLLFLASCAHAQELKFVREDITFYLNAASLRVDGYYWFHNTGSRDAETKIYYPINPKAGRVDSAGVTNMSADRATGISDSSADGFGFTARIRSGDTAVYRIGYRQTVSGDSAMYILLSTRSWNSPLSLAEYRLVVSPPIEVIGFSYKPDTLYDVQGERIYYWKRVDFMPGRNMVFYFRRR